MAGVLFIRTTAYQGRSFFKGSPGGGGGTGKPGGFTTTVVREEEEGAR